MNFSLHSICPGKLGNIETTSHESIQFQPKSDPVDGVVSTSSQDRHAVHGIPEVLDAGIASTNSMHGFNIVPSRHLAAAAEHAKKVLLCIH